MFISAVAYILYPVNNNFSSSSFSIPNIFFTSESITVVNSGAIFVEDIFSSLFLSKALLFENTIFSFNAFSYSSFVIALFLYIKFNTTFCLSKAFSSLEYLVGDFGIEASIAASATVKSFGNLLK